MNFEHEHLLGHVSLLTDVVMAKLHSSEEVRCYVLTSDRDEHIRISRGPPQSYVIEGFLWGHDEFVNKLHVPIWDPRLLITGGGDSYALFWDWNEKKILKRLDFGLPGNNMVTGIWSLETNGNRDVIFMFEAGV